MLNMSVSFIGAYLRMLSPFIVHVNILFSSTQTIFWLPFNSTWTVVSKNNLPAFPLKILKSFLKNYYYLFDLKEDELSWMISGCACVLVAVITASFGLAWTGGIQLIAPGSGATDSLWVQPWLQKLPNTLSEDTRFMSQDVFLFFLNIWMRSFTVL